MPDLLATFESARQFHKEGNAPRAEQLYRQVLWSDPCNAEAVFQLALACKDQGRRPDALTYLQKALAIRPNYAEAHNSQALLLAGKGDLKEAMEGFRLALRHKPDYAEAHHNLGVTLGRQKRLDEAIAAFREAIRLKPDYPDAYTNLAHALEQKGQLDEAIVAYQEYVRLRGEDAAAHNSLGLMLAKRTRTEEAVAAFRQAVKLSPEKPNFRNNLGVALSELGHPELSLEQFEAVVRLQPDHSEGHKSLAMTWLHLGDFERGWAEYEWRLKCKDFTPRKYAQPVWDGTALEGRRLLIYTEQGLGDVIQFIRYVPLVAERGAVVTVECSRPLVTILQSCADTFNVVAQGTPLPDFECHVALVSLPRLLGTTLASIPGDVPYLFADPELVERWRRELSWGDGRAASALAPSPPSPLPRETAEKRCLDPSEPFQNIEKMQARRGPDTFFQQSLRRGRFKVGIAWQGNPKNGSDYRRSLPLTFLAPLAAVPGVELFSLQKGSGTEQLADALGDFPVTDLGGRLDYGNFMMTAAAIANMDLVVACDTSIAHLAGALGKPVWLAISYASDWRWLVDTEESPWYPTMRIFRQPKLGDWQTVSERMAEALAELVSEAPRPRSNAPKIKSARCRVDEKAVGVAKDYGRIPR